MEDDGKFILFYGTAPTLEVAESIAAALVDQQLAACVNIIPGLVSIYVWDGVRQREQEVALIVKTRTELAARVIEEVKRLHPYTNPALVALPVIAGSSEFLAWIQAQTNVHQPPTPTARP